jgi:hypothetical protein
MTVIIRIEVTDPGALDDHRVIRQEGMTGRAEVVESPLQTLSPDSHRRVARIFILRFAGFLERFLGGIAKVLILGGGT